MNAFAPLRIAVLLALTTAVVRAQPVTSPCHAPEASQLDFWVGTWDLTWEGGDGTNVITRRLGDCVIEENFDGNLATGPFRGMSVSLYDARAGLWRQTWVDDQGSYLLFTGGLDDDGVMRLLGEPRTLPDGRRRITRMSWVNVTEDSLDWHWERSFDDGATWEMVWLIHYERAEPDRGR